MASSKCMLRETLEARTPDELFEVLEGHNWLSHRDVSKAKGCYGCGRCSLAMTVEYPDDEEQARVSTTGISLHGRPELKCSDPEALGLITGIRTKFQATEPLHHLDN